MSRPGMHTFLQTSVILYALLLAALVPRAVAKAAYKDHIYVRGVGPLIAGESHPSNTYIYELRFDENHKVQGLKLMGTLQPAGSLVGLSSWGYAYFATNSEIVRYAITGKGLLVDPVSFPVTFPGAMVIDDYYRHAYILQDGGDGSQNIIVARLAPRTGALEFVRSVPMLNDQEDGEYFFDLALTGRMVYAVSAISIGQFSIGADRETLTRQPPLIIPGTNVLTTGCDQFRGPLIVKFPVAYGLHQLGAQTSPCNDYHSELMIFGVDADTGLLSLGTSQLVPNSKTVSKPDSLVIAPALNVVSQYYLYTSDYEATYNTTPCDMIASYSTEAGAQRITGYDANTGEVSDIRLIAKWTGPTTVSCPHTEDCAGFAQDGNRAALRVPLAVSSRGRVLVIGDPGLLVQSVNPPGLPCFPTPTAVARSPKMRLFAIDPDNGTLSPALSKLIPNNQAAVSIHFRRVDRFLNWPIVLEIPTLRVVPLDDFFDFGTKYGPSDEITFRLPTPDEEDVELVIGGFFKARIRHQDFVKEVINNRAVYTFFGEINGAQVDVTIKKLKGGKFSLKFSADPVENLGRLANPVLVEFAIGDFNVATNLTADID